MGIPETIVTIRGLLDKLLAGIKDRETAKLAGDIQRHQFELEKAITQQSAEHVKAIAELRSAHSSEISKIQSEHTKAVKEIEARHTEAIAKKDEELAAVKKELAGIKALQKQWSRKPRPPLKENWQPPDEKPPGWATYT